MRPLPWPNTVSISDLLIEPSPLVSICENSEDVLLDDVVGALCPVHQFVRIGAHAYVGGGTTITQDVLPFSMTSAARNTHAYGMNKVGLERRGFSPERIRKIHHAYKTLLASKLNTSQALEKLKSETDRGEDVDMLIRFIEASERGVIK